MIVQRRLAWPLHKDDTLFQSGRPTGLNIYFTLIFFHPPIRFRLQLYILYILHIHFHSVPYILSAITFYINS